MEIKKDFKNELLKRRELILLVEANSTPSMSDARKLISEELKEDEKLIDVYKIEGSFGSHLFKIFADIYETEEDLRRYTFLRLPKKKKAELKKQEAEKSAEKSSSDESSQNENAGDSDGQSEVQAPNESSEDSQTSEEGKEA